MDESNTSLTRHHLLSDPLTKHHSISPPLNPSGSTKKNHIGSIVVSPAYQTTFQTNIPSTTGITHNSTNTSNSNTSIPLQDHSYTSPHFFSLIQTPLNTTHPSLLLNHSLLSMTSPSNYQPYMYSTTSNSTTLTSASTSTTHPMSLSSSSAFNMNPILSSRSNNSSSCPNTTTATSYSTKNYADIFSDNFGTPFQFQFATFPLLNDLSNPFHPPHSISIPNDTNNNNNTSNNQNFNNQDVNYLNNPPCALFAPDVDLPSNNQVSTSQSKQLNFVISPSNSTPVTFTRHYLKDLKEEEGKTASLSTPQNPLTKTNNTSIRPSSTNLSHSRPVLSSSNIKYNINDLIIDGFTSSQRTHLLTAPKTTTTTTATTSTRSSIQPKYNNSHHTQQQHSSLPLTPLFPDKDKYEASNITTHHLCSQFPPSTLHTHNLNDSTAKSLYYKESNSFELQTIPYNESGTANININTNNASFPMQFTLLDHTHSSSLSSTIINNTATTPRHYNNINNLSSSTHSTSHFRPNKILGSSKPSITPIYSKRGHHTLISIDSADFSSSFPTSSPFSQPPPPQLPPPSTPIGKSIVQTHSTLNISQQHDEPLGLYQQQNHVKTSASETTFHMTTSATLARSTASVTNLSTLRSNNSNNSNNYIKKNRFSQIRNQNSNVTTNSNESIKNYHQFTNKSLSFIFEGQESPFQQLTTQQRLNTLFASTMQDNNNLQFQHEDRQDRENGHVDDNVDVDIDSQFNVSSNTNTNINPTSSPMSTTSSSSTTTPIASTHPRPHKYKTLTDPNTYIRPTTRSATSTTEPIMKEKKVNRYSKLASDLSILPPPFHYPHGQPYPAPPSSTTTTTTTTSAETTRSIASMTSIPAYPPRSHHINFTRFNAATITGFDGNEEELELDLSSPSNANTQTTAVNNNTITRSYLCTMCNKNFDRKPVYQKHMKKHSTQRPHACLYCPKSFTTQANARIHMNTHINYKPFECTQCGKRFTQISTLRNHELIHSGERPHRCACGSSFTQLATLIAHVRRGITSSCQRLYD